MQRSHSDLCSKKTVCLLWLLGLIFCGIADSNWILCMCIRVCVCVYIYVYKVPFLILNQILSYPLGCPVTFEFLLSWSFCCVVYSKGMSQACKWEVSHLKPPIISIHSMLLFSSFFFLITRSIMISITWFNWFTCPWDLMWLIENHDTHCQYFSPAQ